MNWGVDNFGILVFGNSVGCMVYVRVTILVCNGRRTCYGYRGDVEWKFCDFTVGVCLK